MATIDERTYEGGGIVKHLDGASRSLMLENLQQNPYQYPEKSFIREVVSNCIDSIDEKHVARKILSGEAKVEDHYLESKTEMTEASKFDEGYYNLNHLDPVDTVSIIYRERPSQMRDQIIITDSGVGLGGSRLQGYFKPMYSTKRLNKKALGKWGIGAKAGLSTGVESFQMLTRYNGREYEFDIYNDRHNSVVPPFDMETGKDNPYEIWKDIEVYKEDGTTEFIDLKVYYRETSEPNMVRVSMDVKNPIRYKKVYIDAVKSQLTYFKLVTFKRVDEDFDLIETYDVQTPVMYEDEYVIIPENDYYAVPHFVLNNVNYGTIDFAEMEMNRMYGNVGIKVDPSEIDVNQAREAVRYTDKTRTAVKKYLERTKETAQRNLSAEMAKCGEDFLAWIRACKDLRKTNNSIVSRLAGLADLSNLETNFKYKGKEFTHNATNFKQVFRDFRINRIDVTVTEKGAFKTKQTEIRTWGEFSAKNLFLRESVNDTIGSILSGYITQEILQDDHYYVMTPTKWIKTSDESESEMYHIQLEDVHTEFVSMLENSIGFDNLKSVDVPDDFKSAAAVALKEQERLDKEEEKLRKEREAEAALTAEDVRRRDGKFLYHTFRFEEGWNKRAIGDFKIIKTKEEANIDFVSSMFSKPTTIYGTLEDLPLLRSILLFDHTQYRDYTTYNLACRSGFKVILVSKTNVKFVDMYATHVKEALQHFNGSKLKVMGRIAKYNTARVYKEKIYTNAFEYLSIFKNIDDTADKVYSKLSSYLASFGGDRELQNNISGVDSVHSYLDNLAELQMFIATCKDKDAVASKAMELFNNEGIESCDAVDLKIVAAWKAIEDYTSEISGLLSMVNYKNIDDAGKAFIREYIQLKQVPPYEKFLQERFNEFGLKLEEDTLDNLLVNKE